MSIAQISTGEKARTFALGGNATFTLESKRTHDRRTFKMRKSEDGRVYFVSVLTGPDNTTGYEFMGTINAESLKYKHGAKSRLTAESVSAKAFSWAWQMLAAAHMPETANFYHMGKCGRCNRALTVPESIESGFGPECVTKL